MELVLWRTYHPSGTNGDILFNGLKLCNSIELPWKNNQQRISCIPEGKYELVKRYSLRFKWHLQLKDVKGRDLILIHPANDAFMELKGCIAPVTTIQSPGKGLKSRSALELIKAIVYPVLDEKKPFYLTIKS
jgi:hypothetical protein